MKLASRVPPALVGPGQIAAGLVLGGVGTLGMVAVAARGLGEEQFSTFMTWWVTVTLLVNVFGAFEVYLAREYLAAKASGRPTAPVVAQLAGLAFVTVGVVALAAAALAGPISTALFHGDRALARAIGAWAGVGSLQALLRGVATGRRRFDVVGVQLGVDGLARFGLVAACVLLAPGSVALLIGAVVAGALVSVLVAGVPLGRWLARPRPWRAVVSVAPVGWLLVGSVGPILVSSVIASWYAAAARSDVALVAGFSAAMTLARVPTQFISAAFSPMMAQLSISIDRGDEARHDQLLGRALAVCGGFGLLFVAVFVVAGPAVLSVYVGPAYVVPGWVLGLLAAASSGLFLATVEQASLAARMLWPVIAGSWMLATLAFGAVLALPVPALARAAAAPAVAVGIACVLLYLGIRRGASRRRHQPGTRPA